MVGSAGGEYITPFGFFRQTFFSLREVEFDGNLPKPPRPPAFPTRSKEPKGLSLLTFLLEWGIRPRYRRLFFRMCILLSQHSLRKVLKTLTGPAAVVDVSARDGLQAEPSPLSPARRAKWIRLLLDAGVPEVEAGSFVSPRRVPQMAGAGELAALLRPWSPRLWFLVPNRRGAEEALAAGVANLVCVVSATETHSRDNLGRPIARVLDDLRDVARLAEGTGTRFRASISVAWADPVEGAVPPTRVRTIAAQLRDMGFPEITLCDTWGRASPVEVAALIGHLAGAFEADRIGLHLHDTFGTAAAGLLAGALAGVRRFDGSVGGLGGCPFVEGARGNIATEAVVRLLQGMGLETGVDEAALGVAARECLTMLREEGRASCTGAD